MAATADAVSQQELAHHLKGLEVACKKMEMSYRDPQLRHEAESYIQELTKNQRIIEIGKFVLENTKSQMVRQHMAIILRGKVYQNYTPKTRVAFRNIRDTLLNIVISSNLTGGAASGYLQVAAAIIRRSWMEDQDNDKAEFLGKINAGLQPQLTNTHMRLVSLMFLQSLLQEFEPGTDDLEFTSLTCIRQTFEEYFLLDLFKATLVSTQCDIKTLQGLKTAGSPDVAMASKSVELGIKILSKILGWENVDQDSSDVQQPVKFISNEGKGKSTFDSKWQPLMSKDVVAFFYSAYSEHQNEDVFTTYCGQCISSLFDMQKCFATPRDKQNWCNMNAEYFYQFVQQFVQTSMQGNQGINFDTILTNLTVSLSKMTDLPFHPTALQAVQGLTLLCIHGVKEGDDASTDCLPNVLEYWGRVSERSDDANLMGAIASVAPAMVAAYLDARINSPEEDEGGDSERDLHSDELINIAKVARLNQDALKGAVDQGRAFMQDLSNGLDGLYWTIIIVGHIIADSPEGETPSIPTYGISPQGIQAASQLIFDSFETASGSSSLIAETSCWAVKRWAATYIYTDNPQFAMFANEGILNHIIHIMGKHLELFYGDETVVNELIGLMETLACLYRIKNQLKANPAWAQLGQAVLNSLPRLPSSTHTDVMKCLAAILPVDALLMSLDGRLNAIVYPADVNEANAKTLNIPPAKLEALIAGVHGYIGIAKSGVIDIVELYSKIRTWLPVFAILGAREGDNLLWFSLDLFSCIAVEGKVSLMRAIGKEEVGRFYHCLRILTGGVKNQIISLGQNAAFEETSSDLIVKICDIFSDLLDFVMMDSWDRVAGDIVAVCDTDTLISCTDAIVPLVTAKVLTYKNVAKSLMRMINTVISVAPNRLISRDSYQRINVTSKNPADKVGVWNEFFGTRLLLVWAYGIGLEDGEDTSKECMETLFKFIAWLVLHHAEPFGLEEIINPLLERIFFGRISSDMADISGACLLGSVIFYQPGLNQIQGDLVKKFAQGTETITVDPWKVERVNDTFGGFRQSLNALSVKLSPERIQSMLNLRSGDISRAMNDKNGGWFEFKTIWSRFVGDMRDISRGL